MTKPKVRCAIYTRKSSEEGLEQDFNSLDAQREAGEAYVVSQAGEGWKALSARYDDGGFSGGNMQRPGLKKLLEDVEGGEIDVIVVYKVDRLTRSLADFAKIIELLDAKKVSFVSVTQSFNTTTSMGRLTLNVLLSFAQFEREVTGERIRDKIAASKAKGLWMGGTVPLGYDADGRTLKINEAEAKTVVHVFKRYVELGTVPALFDDLQKAGIKSKVRVSASGKKSGGTTMSRGMLFGLLHNRIYLGEICHRGQVFKGQHKAIVSQALWDHAQEAFKNNRYERKSTNTPAAEKYWLTGKLFDAGGRPYTPTYTAGRHGKHYHYYAAQRLRGEQLPLKSGVDRIPRDFLHYLIERGMSEDSNIQKTSVAYPRAIIKRVAINHDRLIIETTINSGPKSGPIELKYKVAKRGRRSEIVVSPEWGERAVTSNNAVLRSIRRSWKWRASLENRTYESVETLASAEAVSATYVLRVLYSSFFPPAATASLVS